MLANTHVNFRAGPATYPALAARGDKPGAVAKEVIIRYFESVDRAVQPLRFSLEELRDIYRTVVEFEGGDADVLPVRLMFAFRRDVLSAEIARLPHFTRMALIDACKRVTRLGGPIAENWIKVKMTPREEFPQ